MTNDEHTFRQARRALENATARLIDPRPERHHNRTVWVPSIYRELREAVHSHKSRSTGRTAEPQPPAWLDGIDLTNVIDSTVQKWVRNPSGPDYPTVNRLRAMTAAKSRPQDTPLLVDRAAQILVWVRRYSALVDQKPLTLPNPCPKCNKRFAYRNLDGEQVRTDALHITLERCVCMSCHVEWPATMFGLLAAQLGYQPIPGVIHDV